MSSLQNLIDQYFADQVFYFLCFLLAADTFFGTIEALAGPNFNWKTFARSGVKACEYVLIFVIIKYMQAEPMIALVIGRELNSLFQNIETANKTLGVDDGGIFTAFLRWYNLKQPPEDTDTPIVPSTPITPTQGG